MACTRVKQTNQIKYKQRHKNDPTRAQLGPCGARAWGPTERQELISRNDMSGYIVQGTRCSHPADYDTLERRQKGMSELGFQEPRFYDGFR